MLKNKVLAKPYASWLAGEIKSEQREYTQPVKLLADDGTLLAPGWARRMVFDYEREKTSILLKYTNS